jgi:hypothetical protein
MIYYGKTLTASGTKLAAGHNNVASVNFFLISAPPGIIGSMLK